jgi:hypothetical protein
MLACRRPTPTSTARVGAHFLDRLVVAAQGGDPGPGPWSDRQPATPPQPTGIVVGEDGLARCWWCGDDPLYRRYHDLEWLVNDHLHRCDIRLAVEDERRQFQRRPGVRQQPT